MTLLYRSTLALTALAALGLTATAQAQTRQFGNRANFNAAAGSLTTFTFDGFAPTNGYTQYRTGLTVSGVGFSGGGAGALFVDDPGDGNGNPFGGHQYLDARVVTVALPTGTTAFGADFSNFDTSTGATLTALVNGVTFTFAVPAGKGSAAGSNFAGIISSVPITSLSFSGGNFGPAIDNVSFGRTANSTVPEPSPALTFAVAGLGLGGLVLAARRKKTNVKASAAL